MKNIIDILIMSLFCSNFLFAQNENQDLNSLSNKFDINNLTAYVYGSNSQGTTVSIDENNDLVFVKIIDNLNMSKDDIYKRAFSYFVYKYKDAKSVIQQQDKEAGIIIGKGYFGDFHCSVEKYKMMGVDLITYDYYNANHLLRIDIKDNRARLILTISNYEVRRSVSASSLLAGTSSMNPNNSISKKIVNCSPIDTASVEERINRELGSTKTNKSARKNMEISMNSLIESEKKAFLPLCKIGATTLMDLEKVLREGNTSKESDNW